MKTGSKSKMKADGAQRAKLRMIRQAFSYQELGMERLFSSYREGMQSKDCL